MVGLVIGKGGDTLKGIAQKSNSKIFIPQKNPHLGHNPSESFNS